MDAHSETDSRPVPVGNSREAALVFWAGPTKIATIRLPVLREACPVDPFDPGTPGPPDLTALPPGMAGVFRSSEPQPETDAGSQREMSPANALRYVVQQYNRRFIDLRDDFDGYMGTFSGKTRSTLRRKLRKFASVSGGTVDWRVCRTPDEMVEFHRHARAVSALTYQEKLFDAGIPEDDAFIAEMQALAAADSVRGYLLSLDNKPVAYLYCPIYDGRVVYGFLGFDPGQAALSPGTVLQLLATEQLFAEGHYRLFDFTEGEGMHKALFSTHQRHCADVFYLRPTVPNRLLVWLHRGCGAMFGALDRLVSTIGLRTWLRQRLRGQHG